MISIGKPGQAIAPLTTVAQMQPNNWRARSALGIAYDFLDEYDKAQTYYEEALAISPGDTIILNNYAFSRALARDIDHALELISKAQRISGDKNPQLRQNHALFLALSGDLEQATEILRKNLPREMANHNIKVLTEIIAEPDRWELLEKTRRVN